MLMNNVLAERPDGTSEDRTHSVLVKQESDRCDENIIIEGSCVFIKEQMYVEDFEDEFCSEDTNETTERNENGCLENVVNVLVEDDVIKVESYGKDEKDLNGTEGYVLPDVNPYINTAGTERAVDTLNIPSLIEGDETKVDEDGGMPGFICETNRNIVLDKRKLRRAQYYAARKANETKEAIEALKKVCFKEKNIACDICGKLFMDKYNVKRHFNRIHSDKEKYHCEICGRGFFYINGLLNHAKNHSIEKKYVCETCGRAFKRDSHLKRHKFTHLEVKPFECCVCGSRFSTMYCLQIHASIHTEERKFECATCGMNFLNRCIFLRHLLTHTSEKSYSCPICDKRFKSSDSVNKHKRLTHKIM